MATIENFLLLCGLQTFVISVVLLVGVMMLRFIVHRRSTTFVAAGLASLVLLWLVACLPFDGWITPRALINAGNDFVMPTTEKVATSDVEFANTDIAAQSPELDQDPVEAFNHESTIARIAAVTLQQMEQWSQPVEAEATLFNWKRGLVWLALATIGIGFVRLFVAYLTIWKLSRSSTELDDANAVAMLAAVQQQLKCNRKVQLFKTKATQAAFTVGWIRPKICLSDNWRSWEPKELEATLAHEVAHISSGDFLQRVVAQLSAALNFYNPIVHYLCGQLCIDQEFNADARAAEVVGGQKNYLNTLASLALQNDYSNHRLAPMFLPTRKSFFRRIEMLRSKQTSRVETPLAKLFSLTVVGLIVVSVAGFRFSEPAATAAIIDMTAAPASKPANLRYVAADADAILILRPAKMLKQEMVRKAFDAIKAEEETNQLDELIKELFGVPAEAIDQLTLACVDLSRDSEPLFIWTVQTSQKGWWAVNDVDSAMQKVLSAKPGDSFRGQKIYFPENPVTSAAYHVADDRTLICSIGSRVSGDMMRGIKSAIRAGNGPSGSWAAAWQSVAEKDVSCVATNNAIDLIQQEMLNNRDVFGPLFTPVLESANFVIAAANHSDQRTDIEAVVHCAEGSDVETTKEAVIGIKAFAKTLIRSAKSRMADSADRPLGNELAEQVLDLPLALLDGLEVKAEANRVAVKTQLSKDQNGLLRPLIPAIISTRVAASRVDSMNNIRQLTLGLHNYHSAYQHFPPPVLTSDQGKKYSWRIAILPFIEGQHIYDQYRFDEEWNSEHNQRITSHVPPVFQHAMEKKDNSKQTSYFMITGEGTPFFGKKGTRIQDMRDGTSNTICLVEAKKDVHWAEPRDINFANGELDTELGGYHENGFNLSMCDGSARFISNKLDDRMLNALITSDGGEIVDHNQIK